MTDRELLELAAKAAGISFFVDSRGRGMQMHGGLMPAPWNPLTDDGDALRLAVRLGFMVEPGRCWHTRHGPAFGEDLLDGEMSSTRRAIVRAAAAIGRELP